MSDQLSARGAMIERRPAHPSITTEQISDLVDSFYGRVRAKNRLAPIFEERVDGNWPAHLAKMKQFWSSVLLRTGEYKGKPVPAHAKLKEVQTEDFVIWLDLFRATVAEIFEPEAQPVVIEAAERIASSLWLAISGNLLKSPPNWSQG